MSEQHDDRVAALERQMQDLQRLLEEERQRRREEKQAAETKVRVLESRLQEVALGGASSTAKSAPPVPRVANLPKKSVPVHRDVAVTTPRTSDNLFAALPSRNGERPVRKVSSVRKAADATSAASGATSKTAVGASSRDGSPSQSGTSQARKSGAGATAATGGASAEPQQETALQHSWDKFCYLARNQFTPQELSLVSAETLRNLLDHYRVRDPVERAQVEAQWALLQEGKETVGGAATPRNKQPAKRAAIKQAEHDAEFCVEIQRAKPHLSRRVALNPEAQRPSNPNDTTSKSGFVRTTSGTVLLTPRTAAPSNPNDVASDSTPRRYCFARAESQTPRSETPRGMRHVSGPTSGEFTPRGIRSNGSTHTGDNKPKVESIKTHIDPSFSDGGARRGLRTFAQTGSPVREHRPSKICSTPPHLMRQRLGTETLSAGGPWPRFKPNSVASRAPFATD